MTVIKSLKIKIFSFLTQYIKFNSIELFTVLPNLKKNLSKPLITVLSRECYDESSSIFPVENKRNLKKLLKINNFSNLKFICANQNPPHSKVLFWQVSHPEILNSPLVIPETWLLTQVLQSNIIYEIDNSKGSYYFAVSQTNFFSSFKSPLIHSAELFSNSCGLSFRDTEKISADKLKDLLFEALLMTPFTDLVQFRFINTSQPKKHINPRVFLPSIIIAIGYLIISSSYLLIKSHRIEARLADIKPYSTELLTLKNQLDADIKSLDMANRLTENKLHTADVWNILYPLFEDEVKFTSIRIDGTKVYLTAHAKSAVNALEILNNNKRVRNARFRGPQRTDRKGERFNLEFEYE